MTASEQMQKDYRMKRLRLKRSIRYKLIAITGCSLLAISVIFTADIWFVEMEKVRRFGLLDQSYDYQTVSSLINTRQTQNGSEGADSGSGMNTSTDGNQEDPFFRRQFPMDIFSLEQKRMGAIILHIIGIIYMFAALALVCDEFFVPSLEIIIEKLHIPEDVAGATFMAAGGSAPEFFTSLIGVFFARNAVGFGTIVGSAVFNILFVIGVVGLLAKHTLLLTWWPLFRDTFFYTIALGTLIGFFQNGRIEWYESLVLFILYVLYVLFMFVNSPAERYSRKLVKKIQDKLCCCRCPCTRSSRVHSVPESSNDSESASGSQRGSSKSLQGSTILVRPMDVSAGDSNGSKSIIPSGVRLTSEGSDTVLSNQTVEHHTLRFSLAKISNTTDSNGVICNNGRPYPVIITESEPPLATELKSFQLPPLEINKPARNSTTSPPSLDLPKVNGRSASIDSGIRSFYGTETESFQSTSRSGSKRNSTTTNVFMEEDPACSEDAGEVIDDKTESDQNQFVQKGGFSRHPHATDSSRTSLSDQSSSAKREDMAENQTTLPSVEQEEEEKGDTDADADADDDDDGIVHIIPPKGLLKIIAYVLLFPLIVLLFFTLPNVKKQRWKCFFPYVFVGSILWIGFFSYFMVWWATEFGDTANIPPSVMGLTFLAAGTSIPDLITSVIVARKGHGDMALSSSIGSNMFDVTVGLPIPWLLFSATNSGNPVIATSNGLFCSVLLLVGMLLVMIISIALFRWKLGKLLGLTYLVMYVVFVTLSILLELVIHCTIGG